MTLTRRRAGSAADLKALGHPVRLRLLELLADRGPLTATQAGGLLGQTAANVSWHLRTLGAAGFVRSLPPGPGRQRPWKVVLEGFDSAESAYPADVDVSIEQDAQFLSRAGRHEPADVDRSQLTVALTDEEARALSAEIRALVAEHRRPSATGEGEARRERKVLVWIAPVDHLKTE